MINWYNSVEEDKSKTFFSIIKNDGFFKSKAQQKFWLSQFKHISLGTEAATHRGFAITQDQFIVDVDGYLKFADYGIRSHRRYSESYVFDQFGILKKYRLRFGYTRDGRQSWIEKEKTELMWERTNSQIPQYLLEDEKKEEVQSTSKFIGMLGDRIVIKGTVKKIFDFGAGPYGPSYMSIIEDVAGNTIVYRGMIGREGEGVHFKATVKDHTIYRDVNQTVVSRPHKIKEEA